MLGLGLGLNRTHGGGQPYDHDAALYMATLTGLTVADKIAINQVFLDIKIGAVNGTDNWTGATSIQLFATNDSTNQSKNAKTIGSQSATFFGTPAPVPSVDGVTLDGVNNYIKSGYNNTSISINNFAKLVFIKNEVALNSYVTYLSTSATNLIAVERNNSTGGIGTWALAGGAVTPRTPGVVNGMVGVGRKDSSTKGKYIDNVLTEYADTRTASAPTVETFIGQYPDGSERLKGTVQFIWEGTYRSAAQYADLIAALTKFNALRAGGMIYGVSSSVNWGDSGGINWGS